MLYGGVRAGDYAGPFLNHSHFGEFMNLSIGATLALVLVRCGEITDGNIGGIRSVSGLLAALPADIWLLIGAAIFSAATISFKCRATIWRPGEANMSPIKSKFVKN